MLPTVIGDLSITAFQAGVALSIGSIAYAILQFPSGRLSDQLSRKTIIISGLVVMLIGCLILSVTVAYALLVLGIVILAFGEGLYGPADRGLLADLYIDKRGAAFGIHTTFTDISGIVAAGLGTAAIAYGAWQSAYPPIVVGIVVVIVLVMGFGREPMVIERIRFDLRETVSRLLFIPRFLWILLAYSLFSVTTMGVLGFLPTFLQVDQGFTVTLANTAFATMFVTGILFRPIAGRLSDFHNRLTIAGSGLGIAAVGLSMLLVFHSNLVVFAGVVVFAAGMRSFPPTMQAFLMDMFPEGSMAGDLGATRTVYIILGSVGPAYVGFVAERLSYTVAFAVLVAVLIVGSVITIGLMLTAESSG
jgi:MFS family permease